MKFMNKKTICMLMVFALILGCMVQMPAQAQTTADCKTLCAAALKATGGSSKLNTEAETGAAAGGVPSRNPLP